MNPSKAEDQRQHSFCLLSSCQRELKDRSKDSFILLDNTVVRTAERAAMRSWIWKALRHGQFLVTTGHLMRPLMDDLPPDVAAAEISASGEPLWTSTDPEYQHGWATYYPSVAEYQLRCPIETVLRSQLAVVQRFVGGVDKVVLCLPGSSPKKIIRRRQ
ncbi:hypothetical protein VTI74DRAFT_1872 [Chaetomium olivicolor]